MEKLRIDCSLCQDPIGGRPVFKRGFLAHAGEQIKWAVIPSRPSSVIMGQHLIFTTISHHVGSGEKEVRKQLMRICLNLGWKLLGDNFRMALNQGPKASSFEHFHAHLIAPGTGERFVSLTANIPQKLDEAAANGLISPEAAKTLKEQILQKAR